MYKLTVFQPAYRVNKWQEYLESIEISCTTHPYEVVFCGPNEPDFELPDNCKFILDRGSPARCSNRAAQESSGELVLLGSDDAIFLPHLLDSLIDFYSIVKKSYRTIVPIKYGEANTWMADDYWKMYFHPPLQLKGVPPESLIILNYLGSREYWLEMGGYDCINYNTCNFGGHDLSLRLQSDTDEIFQFPQHIMMCEWSHGTKDHSPMVASEIFDYTKFTEMYNEPINRKHIDIDNWKLSPEVWSFAEMRK